MNKKVITKKYRSILRMGLNRKNREKLENKDFTILSSNCVGGVILHELGKRFDTPTINLYFSAGDYLKFIGNLKHYLNCKLTETDSSYAYPLGKLEDLTLHLVHYKNFAEAEQKWEERKKRIHFDNLYVIMVDRDGCTYKDIIEFDSLPYEHKAFLTYKERPEIKSAVCIPGSEEENHILDICKYKSKWTGRRWLDDFDYVAFLNTK